MDDLLRAVGSRCRDLGMPPPRSGMVVGLDRDRGGKVTTVLFGADGRPTVVVKVAREPRQDAALQAEHAVLTALVTRDLPTVRAQVPTPLFLDRVAGRTVLAMSAVRGGPLMVRYHEPGHVGRPAQVAQDLELAGGWLAAFQEDTSCGWTGCAEAFRTYAVPAFDRYRAAFGADERADQVAARCAEDADRLVGTAVPLCAVHGDLAPGNVLVDGSGRGRVRVSGVVDWELGRGLGAPFTDLFKFVASYGSFLDRAAAPSRDGLRDHPGWADVHRGLGLRDPWPNLVGFLYAFTGEGWFPDLVRRYLAAGYRRLGVPAAVQDVFLPAFVAEQATTLTDPVYRQGYRSVLHALGTRPARVPATSAAGRP